MRGKKECKRETNQCKTIPLKSTKENKRERERERDYKESTLVRGSDSPRERKSNRANSKTIEQNQ